MKVSFLGQLKVIFLSPLYTLDLSHLMGGKVWWHKKSLCWALQDLDFYLPLICRVSSLGLSFLIFKEHMS